MDDLGYHLERRAKKDGRWEGTVRVWHGQHVYGVACGRLVYDRTLGAPGWHEDTPEVLPEAVHFWSEPDEMTGAATPAGRRALERRRAELEAGRRVLEQERGPEDAEAAAFREASARSLR